MLLVILAVKKFLECFTKRIRKKKKKKTDQKEFKVEKVIKRKGDKLYVKCKGYDIVIKKWVILHLTVIVKTR